MTPLQCPKCSTDDAMLGCNRVDCERRNMVQFGPDGMLYKAPLDAPPPKPMPRPSFVWTLFHNLAIGMGLGAGFAVCYVVVRLVL